MSIAGLSAEDVGLLESAVSDIEVMKRGHAACEASLVRRRAPRQRCRNAGAARGGRDWQHRAAARHVGRGDLVPLSCNSCFRILGPIKTRLDLTVGNI